MEILLAKSAGFCFGVKRAVETAYEKIETEHNLYTYGPIIHNDEVVKDLEGKGVQVLNGEKELETMRDATIIVRAHGVSESVIQSIEKKGWKCVDATCPFVKRIHKIVEKESLAGKHIVIVGSEVHPEVEGIMGWCHGPVTVIESKEEARICDLPEEKEICIVSQTTFNFKKFQDIVEIIGIRGYNVSVVNTICNATEERQKEASEIASKVDVMIVIGGKHSSNSRKLYEICKEQCKETYFIQTLDDLHLELPKSVRLVGITAGASTPNNIIEEVQNYVRINF